MIEYHWKGRRYNVVAGTYGDYVDLHPIYGDKLSIKHSMPDDERYYKESFNGTLKFVRDDYSWIMDAVDGVTRFNTIYELELWTQTQKVTTLKFVITDCEVDEDNGIITVKPSTKSRYDDLLNGLDREFNLVELNPVIEQLTWYRRALLQFTTSNSEVITNCLGGITWNENKVNSGDLINTYKFAISDIFQVAELTLEGEGVYYGRTQAASYDNLRDYELQRGLYIVTSNYEYKLRLYETYSSGEFYFHVELYRKLIGGNYSLFASSQTYGGFIPDTLTNLFLYNGNNQHVTTVNLKTIKVYARILCDVGGDGAEVRPTADIMPYSNNYRYVLPYSNNISTIIASKSNTPNEYGPFTYYTVSGYYMPPSPVGYLPLQQSDWVSGVSMWVDLSLVPDYFSRNKTMSLRHAYPLYSAIKVLLAEIAPDLSFDETTAYSEFLFDYHENTHPLVQDVVHLFITPKTNILNGDYQTPAYNAPIKLKEILDMLKAVYKCYWFIDTDNKLRIEHVSWFMNGGTYGNPSENIRYDLTTLRNTRNGKLWGYETSKYTFDKPNMPATYTFAWMDEVTQEFKGYQMEMQSCLVEKGKNEEITVNKFTSDIDFVTITPDDISKDGFMLLGASYDSNNQYYYLPFYPLRIEGTNIINYLQNGFLAYIYLQKNEIWLSDLPAGMVEYADGDEKAVFKQSRMMKQNVTVPMTTPIFDPITLIKTGLGNGEIQDIEINISSLTGKATLKYDTQQ